MTPLIQRLVFIVSVLFASNSLADECVRWFKSSKLAPSTRNCLSKCLSLKTGLDTFPCPQSCPRFCDTPTAQELLLNLAYYPGLTAAERALIAEYPEAALKVYQQMKIAEQITLKLLRRSTQQNESDAIRHYVWAGLLSKELVDEKAQKFLDAHEAGPLNPNEDRAMDLANNRAGILEAGRLRKSNNLTEAAIEEKAVEALKQGKLVILTPRGGI